MTLLRSESSPDKQTDGWSPASSLTSRPIAFHLVDITMATLTPCSSNNPHLRTFAHAVPAIWHALAPDTHRFTPLCCSGICSNVTDHEGPPLTKPYKTGIYTPPHLCRFACFISLYTFYCLFIAYLSSPEHKLFESRLLFAAVSQHLKHCLVCTSAQ